MYVIDHRARETSVQNKPVKRPLLVLTCSPVLASVQGDLFDRWCLAKAVLTPTLCKNFSFGSV